MPSGRRVLPRTFASSSLRAVQKKSNDGFWSRLLRKHLILTRSVRRNFRQICSQSSFRGHLLAACQIAIDWLRRPFYFDSKGRFQSAATSVIRILMNWLIIKREKREAFLSFGLSFAQLVFFQFEVCCVSIIRVYGLITLDIDLQSLFNLLISPRLCFGQLNSVLGTMHWFKRINP